MNKKNKEIIIRSSLRNFPFNAIKTAKSFYSMAKRGEKASLPYKIQMESAGICNLKCRMCPQNNMKRQKGFLKFALFKKIFDQIKPPYLNLTGFGEPLMNPEIFKIIEYAKKNKTFVKLDTNGMLLDDEKIKKLLRAKIDIVSNSIDGMDKKTYEKIRRGADFDKVIGNLKKFVRARDFGGFKTEIHLFLVLQKDNFRQFPDFIRFGDSLGVDSISGTFVAEESYAKNHDVNIENCKKEELDELVRNMNELKKNTKANLEIDEIIEYIYTWKDKKKKNWSKVPCYKPWYSPFIYWDGVIAPCCYCVDKEIILGDLKKESFKSVWNGKKMRKFRKMVATNRIGLCSRCEADETYIKKQFEKIPFL